MPETDAYGTPESTGKRPQRRYVSVSSRKSRNYGSLISQSYDQLTTVIAHLRNGDMGALRDQKMMFLRMIELDERLSAVYSTRLEALLQSEYAFAPARGDTSDEPVAFVEEQVERVDLLRVISEQYGAVWHGSGLHEIEYARDWSLAGVHWVPEWYLDWTGDDLRILQGAKVIRLEPDKYIRTVITTHPGPLWRQGLMRTLSILWCIKHHAIKDWAAFNEVFGMPLRVGKYPTDANDKDVAALRTGLEDLGTDAAALIPDSMEIEFMELKAQNTSGTSTPIERSIAWIDKAYTIRALGSHLATESVQGSGTLAGSAQERPTDWIVRGDARRISAILQRDLFSPLVRFNLGPNAPVPRLAWPGLDDTVDQQQRGHVFARALSLGVPVSKRQVMEELQLREPEGDEDTLESLEEAPVLKDAGSDVTELSERSSLPLGSPHRAGEKIVRSAAGDVAQQLSQLDALVTHRIEDVLHQHADAPEAQQLEMVLARLRLDAGDLDQLISDAGIDRAELEESILEVLLAAAVNGRQSIKDEGEA